MNDQQEFCLPSLFLHNIADFLFYSVDDIVNFMSLQMNLAEDRLPKSIKSHIRAKRSDHGSYCKSIDSILKTICTKSFQYQRLLDLIYIDDTLANLHNIAKETADDILEKLDELAMMNTGTGFSVGTVKTMKDYSKNFNYSKERIEGIITFLILPCIEENALMDRFIDELYHVAGLCFKIDDDHNIAEMFSSKEVECLNKIVCQCDDLSNVSNMRNCLSSLFRALKQIQRSVRPAQEFNKHVPKENDYIIEDEIKRQVLYCISTSVATVGLRQDEINGMIQKIYDMIMRDYMFLWNRGCRYRIADMFKHKGFMALAQYRIYRYLLKNTPSEYMVGLAWDLFEKSCLDNNVVLHPYAAIEEKVFIGNGSLVSGHTEIGTHTYIGDNVRLLPIKRGSDGMLRIKKRCSIMDNTTIIGDITIGERCIISDSQVVTSHLADNQYYTRNAVAEYPNYEEVYQGVRSRLFARIRMGG